MKKLLMLLLMIPVISFSQELTKEENNWLKQGEKELKEITKLNNMTEKKILEACPMWNFMFLTCNKRAQSKNGIIIAVGSDVYDIKQDIIKIGDSVRTLKPGYTVEIDPRPYIVKDWKDQNNPTLVEEMERKATKAIAWPIQIIDGVEVMVVPDSHIRMFWKNGLE